MADVKLLDPDLAEISEIEKMVGDLHTVFRVKLFYPTKSSLKDQDAIELAINILCYTGVKASFLYERYGEEEHCNLLRKVKRALAFFWHLAPKPKIWCETFKHLERCYSTDIELLISLIEGEQARNEIVALLVARELSNESVVPA
jgi:hypothetical protein